MQFQSCPAVWLGGWRYCNDLCLARRAEFTSTIDRFRTICTRPSSQPDGLVPWILRSTSLPRKQWLFLDVLRRKSATGGDRLGDTSQCLIETQLPGTRRAIAAIGCTRLTTCGQSCCSFTAVVKAGLQSRFEDNSHVIHKWCQQKILRQKIRQED